MSDDKPYLLDGHMYQYDLGWMIEQLKQQKKALETALDNQTITYADPIQWDITSQYAPITIVVNPQTGTAYISKQAVPQGIQLTNTDYWLPIFNYQEGLTPVMQGTALSVESGTTATKDYLVNDLLWYKSALYRVTRPLAVGDDLTPNYNITTTSVESLLARYYGRDRVAQIENETVNVSGDYALHAGDIAEDADNITLHSKKDTIIDADGNYTEQISGNREIDVDGTDSVHVDGVTTINRGGAVTEVYGSSVDRRVTGALTEIFGGTATSTYNGKRIINGGSLSETYTGDANISAGSAALAIGAKTLPITFPDKVLDLYKLSDTPKATTVYNVKDYGATGDGSTDDTAAIQACINAAEAYGTVYFPKGVYMITSSLIYLSGQLWIGVGMTIKAAESFPAQSYMVRPRNTTTGGYSANNYNIFYGIEFHANGKVITSLILAHSTYNKVITCRFKGNSGWHMLEINSSQHALVDGCYFSDYTADSSEMLQLDSATSEGSPDIPPYDGTTTQYCIITNCFFKGSFSGSGTLTKTAAGIGSHANIAAYTNNVISNCIFSTCWIGIAARAFVGLTVTGCLFHTCCVGAWFNKDATTSGADRCRYLNFRNNTLYTTQKGIDMTPASIKTPSDFCMICDNQIVNIGTNSLIHYFDKSSLIHGNVLKGTVTALSGSAAIVHNNLISDTWTA